MLFESRRHRRRRQVLEAGFRPEWREVLSRNLYDWNLLNDDERTRVEQLALELVADVEWEPANGFELTDDIVVTIAGQGALMAMALPDGALAQVGTVVVHPTTLVVEGEHSQVEGIVSDDPMELLGEAEYGGPVFIVWDEARHEARHPRRGRNVVVHELAHKLDMLDGTVDGTPPLESRDELDRWVEVCTAVYDDVVRGTAGEVLDPYAGVNPGEFFAVASEAFFSVPDALGREHPDLYDVLMGYYRQDPAARRRRPRRRSDA